MLYLHARVLGFLLFHVPMEAFLEVSHAITARGSAKHEAQIFRTWRALGAAFSPFDDDIADLTSFFDLLRFAEDEDCLCFVFCLLASRFALFLIDGFACFSIPFALSSTLRDDLVPFIAAVLEDSPLAGGAARLGMHVTLS